MPKLSELIAQASTSNCLRMRRIINMDMLKAWKNEYISVSTPPKQKTFFFPLKLHSLSRSINKFDPMATQSVSLDRFNNIVIKGHINHINDDDILNLESIVLNSIITNNAATDYFHYLDNETWQVTYNQELLSHFYLVSILRSIKSKRFLELLDRYNLSTQILYDRGYSLFNLDHFLKKEE